MVNFHYNQVPQTFLHCIAEDCPRQTDCVRWVTYQHIPDQVESLRIVNLRRIASIDKNNCPYFLKIQAVRYAKGLKHVLDKLPHEAVQKLRKDLIAYFGHTRYYRFVREERLIPPQEQKMMQRIFEDNGFPEALYFHEYIDSFVFHPSEIKMSVG